MSATQPAEYRVQHLRDALALDARSSALGLDVGLIGDQLVVSGVVATDGQRAAVEEVVRDHLDEEGLAVRPPCFDLQLMAHDVPPTTDPDELLT